MGLPSLRLLLTFLTLVAAALPGRLRAQAAPLWTDVSPPALAEQNVGLTSVDFGNGTFVAAGYLYVSDLDDAARYGVFTSPDGVHWTQQQGAPAAGRVRFAGGNFYLATQPNPDSLLYASPDGTAWTRVADLGKNAGGIADLASGNGVTVISRPPDDPVDDDVLPIVSADLVHWTARTLASSEYRSLTRVAFINDRFVLAGESFGGPSAYTSTDGANWSPLALTAAYGGFGWIAAGNGVALLPSGDHDFQLSTDGLTWTTASPGLQMPSVYGFSSPIPLLYARFLNGQFVGSANVYDQKTVSLYASGDAQHWRRLGALPGTAAVSDLAFGNGAYVAVSGAHIYSVAASAVDGGSGKACHLGGVIDDVTVKTKALKATQVISGAFTLTNTGALTARNVQASVFLSDSQTLDRAIDAPGRTYLGTVSLADAGYPKVGRNGKAAGPVPFKYHVRTDSGLAASGKYLLVLVDPQQLLNESDRSGEVMVYGPLL